MTNKAISQLPDVVTLPLSGSELLVLVQAGVTSKITIDNLFLGPESSSWVGFQQSGIGSGVRTIQAKQREIVSVTDFTGVDITGVSDSTAGVQAALTSMSLGGIVVVPSTVKLFIGSSLTVPTGVTLKGRWQNPEQVGNPASPTYSAFGSSIRLASTATISLGMGSGLENLLIYRSGMTFPVADSTLYAGTAITGTANGNILRNLLVMGFDKLFYSAGNQRHVIDRVFGDNQNGLDISGSPDVCYITKCHMWPFAANTNIYPSAAVFRTGIAYYFHDTADWFNATDNFSYAYFRGFRIANANSINLTNCAADNNFPAAQAGSVGILVDGTSSDTKLIGTKTAAQDQGIVINTSAGKHTEIVAHSSWANTAHNLTINQGDVSIVGGTSRDGVNGVTVANAASKVLIEGIRFSGISSQPILVSVANPYIQIGINDYGDFPNGTQAAANMTLQSLASASNILIPASDEVFNITGTTNISFLSGWRSKRKLTLIFGSALVVANGGSGTAGIRLNGGVNFTVAANSTLSLIHDGTGWIETGRKV